jgi:hypothetical protein
MAFRLREMPSLEGHSEQEAGTAWSPEEKIGAVNN